MATTKLGFVTLLLGIIIVVVGSQVKHAEACTKNCDGRAEYMICPYASEGESKVKEVGGICTNCCVAKEQHCILIDETGFAYCPEEEASSLPRKIIASIVN
ncbi:PREDICTED: proteinase inhibitor type-2 CEVI57-like [Ipomoea nil]|uniref:proteinase inhibitor type-2 CEVI57-like n=1 Tax=Ipomoea nil TaxID=35883 RepID=UPI0009010820|nr:PREDICTED: proteinase inhibitor type-2 CEVI57-like [Ipomoea nil]